MPSPVSSKKKDLRYGDLVEFVYDVKEDGNTVLHARIYGRVAPRWSSSNFQNKQTYYLVKPFEKIGEEIEVDLINAIMAMVGDVELEWGSVPPQPYLTVPEQMLSPLFGGSMTSRFKSKGLCPRCGDPGFWKAMACFCPWHGKFIG